MQMVRTKGMMMNEGSIYQIGCEWNVMYKLDGRGEKRVVYGEWVKAVWARCDSVIYESEEGKTARKICIAMMQAVQGKRVYPLTHEPTFPIHLNSLPPPSPSTLPPHHPPLPPQWIR